MDQVEAPAPGQRRELGDARGGGPVAQGAGGDELQPARLDPLDQRAGFAVDDHVVAGLGGAGGEVDRVDLTATDAEVVRRDQQPQRTASRCCGWAAGRAGEPYQTWPRGIGLVTTAPMPTIAPAPIESCSRRSAPAPM